MFSFGELKEFGEIKLPTTQINLDKTNESLTLMEENLLGRDAALVATEEELKKVNKKININELLLLTLKKS